MGKNMFRGRKKKKKKKSYQKGYCSRSKSLRSKSLGHKEYYYMVVIPTEGKTTLRSAFQSFCPFFLFLSTDPVPEHQMLRKVRIKVSWRGELGWLGREGVRHCLMRFPLLL